MHDVLIAVSAIAMILSPCVITLVPKDVIPLPGSDARSQAE